MANAKNTESLAMLRGALKGRTNFFLVDYQGLSSEGLGQLRKELRGQGAKLLVAKNTIINLALKDGGFDFANALKGPSALVLIDTDPVGAAKALTEFAKKNDKGIPTAKGGVLEGSVINAKQLEDVAKLPSKNELRAELVGVLEATQSNFVSVLGGKQQELVGILDAKVQKG